MFLLILARFDHFLVQASKLHREVDWCHVKISIDRPVHASQDMTASTSLRLPTGCQSSLPWSQDGKNGGARVDGMLVVIHADKNTAITAQIDVVMKKIRFNYYHCYSKHCVCMRMSTVMYVFDPIMPIDVRNRANAQTPYK